jgi:hypothetical protein
MKPGKPVRFIDQQRSVLWLSKGYFEFSILYGMPGMVSTSASMAMLPSIMITTAHALSADWLLQP